MAWDDTTEITVRLSLRGEELWVLAGSGLLARFIIASDGEFDMVTIGHVVDEILRGAAVEFFGTDSQTIDGPGIATGFTLKSGLVAGGLDAQQAAFTARLAGPLARAKSSATD